MSRKVRSKVTSISSRGNDLWNNGDNSWDCGSEYGYSNSYAPSTDSSHIFKNKDYCKRECISIHLGQAGVQISTACWQLYCLEHNIGSDGRPLNSIDGSGGDAFFQELESGKYIPRALMVDLEPSVVDQIRTGEFKDLYHPDQLLTGNEDAANNYARGYLSVGKTMLAPVMDWIHKMTDDCDSLLGFLLFRSLGGGTGSGFTAHLLEMLNHEFPKKNKLEFLVYPSPKYMQVSSAMVEPYNAVLTTHTCMDFADVSFMVDNEALYEICVKRLDICRPNFTHLNHVIGQVASSVTTSLRFSGALNIDMNEFQTNLVPFHRLHFPVTSYAPIMSHRRANHENVSVKDITSSCFNGSHQLLRCDMTKGKYIACCMLYRGDVNPKEINSSIFRVKSNRIINFVDWSPTGFKLAMNSQMPCTVQDGNMAQARRAVCMMSNNTAIVEKLQELGKKFDLMHKKGAFLHWYNREGMCDQEFCDARDNLAVLNKDYEEVNES